MIKTAIFDVSGFSSSSSYFSSSFSCSSFMKYFRAVSWYPLCIHLSYGEFLQGVYTAIRALTRLLDSRFPWGFLHISIAGSSHRYICLHNYRMYNNCFIIQLQHLCITDFAYVGRREAASVPGEHYTFSCILLNQYTDWLFLSFFLSPLTVLVRYIKVQEIVCKWFWSVIFTKRVLRGFNFYD